jgi:hypothetical protein
VAVNRTIAQMTTTGTTQSSTSSRRWAPGVPVASTPRAVVRTDAAPMAMMATAQAALSTRLILLNVGESQYSRGVVRRAYSAVNGSTGTVSRR